MADEDDQDIFDSLEREASEFTKVRLPQWWWFYQERDTNTSQDAEIDRIRKAFSLDA